MLTAIHELLPDLLDWQPGQPAEALAQLPAKPGVWVLLAQGEIPVLAATSQNMRASVAGRLTAPDPAQRSKRTDLSQTVVACRYCVTYGRLESDWLYGKLVHAVWPRGLLGPRRLRPHVDAQGLPRRRHHETPADHHLARRARRHRPGSDDHPLRRPGSRRHPDRPVRPVPLLADPRQGPARHPLRLPRDGPQPRPLCRPDPHGPVQPDRPRGDGLRRPRPCERPGCTKRPR